MEQCFELARKLWGDGQGVEMRAVVDFLVQYNMEAYELLPCSRSDYMPERFSRVGCPIYVSIQLGCSAVVQLGQ